MIKSTFAKKSLIMILSNIATSILGFMFSIALSKQLGPEGMGLYGLIKPINRIFLCIVCGGLFTAVSKVSAQYYGIGDYKNFKRTIQTSFTFTLIWSVFISAILFFLAPAISTYIIKDVRTINAIRLLCPAVVFIALSSCIEGYFISTFQIVVPMFIDIFEKAIRICILVFVISALQTADITSTVTGAYFALCIGEFMSFMLLYGYYKLNIKKVPTSTHRSESRAQLLFDTLSTSFPLLTTNLISSILSTFSTLIVPRRLVEAGLDYKVALGLIGKYNGMAKNIPFFPMVIVESISILLVPDLSRSLGNKDHNAINRRISKVLELSFLLGATSLAITLCIGDSLGILLYKRMDLGNYIKFAALAAPILYVSSSTFAILNGIGKQKTILRTSIIISVLRIIFLYVFTGIPSINVYGYGLTIIITSIVSLVLNLWEINKVSPLDFSFFHSILQVLIVVLTYFLLLMIKSLLLVAPLIISSVIIILSGFSMVFFLSKIIKV